MLRVTPQTSQTAGKDLCTWFTFCCPSCYNLNLILVNRLAKHFAFSNNFCYALGWFDKHGVIKSDQIIQFLQKLKNITVHFLAVYPQSQSFTCTCLGEVYHKIHYFCTQYKIPFPDLLCFHICRSRTSMFFRNIKLQTYKGNTFCLLSEEGKPV